jgi:uncharacterized metal-binding protein YceD (DUF177 family)
MSGLFTIPIGGLKEGLRIFEFKIDSTFFSRFEDSELREGDLKAEVCAEKRSSHMDLMIRITGTVDLPCDRCLETFKHRVACENRILIKFGKAHDETDPDIITLAKDENELDLAHFFYEFISLALPIQRVHPSKPGSINGCDPGMIEKLNEHIVNEEETDPRWNELKKLINNN